jgi:Ca2+-binding EF-hand superfamily protein
MAKGSGSKKAKKGSSNVFALFSQRQIQEFKEAFGIMDTDKDGILSSSDLVKAFAAVGKSISDGEASGMLSEAPGPVNFTQMVMLFAEKMAGGADDDDTIGKAFEAFEVNGKIDAEMFKHSLMTFGDKFTSSEVDNAYNEFQIADGQIDSVHLKSLMVAKKEEGEE